MFISYLLFKVFSHDGATVGTLLYRQYPLFHEKVFRNQPNDMAVTADTLFNLW